jgi:hypothetical protein
LKRQLALFKIVGPKNFDNRVQIKSIKVKAFYIYLQGILACEEFRSGFDEIDIAGQRRSFSP